MSSGIAHFAAGASIYLCRCRISDSDTRWGLLLSAFLAMVPDIDYVAIWLFRINPKPRITHSLVFCALVAGAAWFVSLCKKQEGSDTLPFLSLLAASTSHLLLDLLVGVHSLPILCPFISAEVMFPIGILPSAGHLHIANYYFWRNLSIELGVLLPVFSAVIAWRQQMSSALLWSRGKFIFPVWLAFLTWSISLSR